MVKCEANCSFCGFKRKSGQEGAYTMHEEELLEYVSKRWNDGIQEFHIVGGHNTDVSFDYYLDTIPCSNTPGIPKVSASEPSPTTR